MNDKIKNGKVEMLNYNHEPENIKIDINKIICNETIKAIEKRFVFDNNIIKRIESTMEELSTELIKQIDSWLIGKLKEFGINEEEINERVCLLISDLLHPCQKNHIFIDGKYTFSFYYEYDFSENNKDFVICIKQEYIPKMKEFDN